MNSQNLHEHNRAWFTAFAKKPHHALVVELNHPLEADHVLSLFAQHVNVSGPIMIGSEASVAIEDIREMQRLAKLRKTATERQLFALDIQSGISHAAQNSLLKLLEEPPQNTFFVLLTMSATQVLPTILSRARLLKMLPLPEAQFAEQLRAARQAASESDIRRLTAMFNGSFVAAEVDELSDFEGVRQFLGSPLDQRLQRVKSLKERSSAEKFLDDLLLLSAQTQRSTAQSGKKAATSVWLRITLATLRAKAAIRQNGSVSLHLQRLALTIPAIN